MKSLLSPSICFHFPRTYLTGNIAEYTNFPHTAPVCVVAMAVCSDIQVMWQVFRSDSNSASPFYFCRMNKIHFINFSSISSLIEFFTR